jgi:transposase-like protein
MRRKQPPLFKGRHFDAAIIVLCVRWYLRFSLSFRDLEEMMAERNLSVDHVTIWRWVQRYAPELKPPLPAGNPQDQRFVALRRNLCSGRRQVDLFISRRGFDGRHD